MPVQANPSASGKTRLGVSAFATVVFVFTLGSVGVRNLVGLPAFFVLAALITIGAVWMFVKLKPARFRWYRLPSPLYWFLTLAVLSIAWSAYRFESVLGVTLQLMTTVVAVSLAFVLTWHEVLRTLSTALRYLIGLSLLFELWVSVFIQHPVMPWWLEQPATGKPLKLLYWSRDLLFEGGPIQGVVANSALLSFLALAGLIVFAIQLRAGLVGKFAGWFWVVLAVATLALTRSAAIMVACVAVAAVLGFALWARQVGPERRVPVYLTAAGLLAAVAAVLAVASSWVWALLGKSADLTGRTEIWSKVWHLITEHPWFGWGWVSYWPVWVEPFKGLDTKAGLPVMHAHNAWLDVWLQLGVVGVLVFAPLVVLTFFRVWFRAVDQPRRGPGPALPYATSALWPLLLMVALIIQSLTESRLLIEGHWILLVIFAVKSRFDFELPSRDTEPEKIPWRRVPIVRSPGGERAS